MEDLNELTDLFLQCKTCYEYFVFDVFEQAYFAERGLHQPKRCKNCRNGANSGDSNENESKQTTVTCASCGVETTVPFKPRKAVFCKLCYTQGRDVSTEE